MGCCESRDDEKRQQKVKSFTSPRSMKNVNFLNLQDQDLMVIPENCHISRHTKDSKETESTTIYLDWCRSVKKWEELIKLTSDNTEISEALAYVNWASKPTTISSLAIVYLCIELKKSSEELHPKLEPVIKDLIFQIPLKRVDYQENTMLLLFCFLDKSSENTVRLIIKFGGFGVINKFLNSERKEMKHLTMCVCWKLYRNRAYAQESFLNFNGGFKLLMLLKDPVCESFISDLLSGIIDLLYIENVGVVQSNLKRLNLETLWEELDKLTKHESSEVLEKVDVLVNILTSFK
jgi:hypothetical protein